MIIKHLNLKEVVTRICVEAGTEESLAQQVAELLVAANLKGHDSHGVQMLPIYTYNIAMGHLLPNQHAELESELGSNLIVDGKTGYGQIVGPEAMEMGMESARQHGASIVALKNAHHLGRIGGMGEQCAAAGFISMHYVNVVGHPPMVAPFGGTEPRMGTNPFCCAIPNPDGEPVILDMATSSIAQGKVRVAYNSGNQVPDGSLIDNRGLPTTDPAVMFEEPLGALAHFGKHKGYGLALVCELLGGALVGGWSMQPGNERVGTVVNHMLTIIIDPDAVGSKTRFHSEVNAMLAYLKSCPAAEGVDSVLVAGDPERIAYAERSVNGIQIDETTWSQITRAAERVGIDSSTLNAMALI